MEWVAQASSDEIEARLRALGPSDVRTDLIVAVRMRAAGWLLSHPGDAARVGRVLLDVLDESAKAESWAVAWRINAEAQTYLGELVQARSSYENADRFARSSGNDVLLGEILVGRVGVLAGLEDPRAPGVAAEARACLERTGHEEYMAKLLINLGNVAFHTERPEVAHAEYTKARAVLARLGRRDDTYWGLLVNLGIASTQLLRMDDARAALEEVLSAAVAAGSDHLASHAGFNLSFVDRAQGRYEDALRRLEDAEEGFAAVSAVDLAALTRLTRAEIYLDLGLCREALEHAGTAKSEFRSQGKGIDADYAALVEAESWAENGYVSRARQGFQDVVASSQSAGARRRRLESRLGLARLALTDDPTNVERHLLSDSEAEGFETVLAENDLVRARGARASGSLQAAEASARRVLARLERLPQRLAVPTRTLAGAIAREQGWVEASRKHLNEAVRVAEDVRRSLPGADFRAASYGSYIEALREQLETEIVAGTPGDLLVAEGRKLRGRSFRDRKRHEDFSGELAAKQARLGALVHRRDRELLGEQGASSDELDREVAALEADVLDSLRRWDVRNPQPEHDPGAGHEDQDRPGRGEAWIEYFPAARSVLTAIHSSDGQSTRVLPSTREEIEAKLSELRFNVDSYLTLRRGGVADDRFLRRAADAVLGQLYEMLVRPLEESIAGKTSVRIIPSSFLHQVPYACLWDGRGYFGDRFHLRTSLGVTAPFLADDARTRPLDVSRVALMGIVRSGPAEVRSELESIRSALPAGAVSVTLDPSYSAFMEALRKEPVVHLATHGSFQEENPLFSRLALSDRSVFVLDLQRERLSTELVVLSACETGRTFRGAGDELQGLAHAFLAAGTRNLVASHWRVDDAATRSLMIHFYDHLFRGNVTVADALTAARKRTREDGWSHPFLWGAFTALTL